MVGGGLRDRPCDAGRPSSPLRSGSLLFSSGSFYGALVEDLRPCLPDSAKVSFVIVLYEPLFVGLEVSLKGMMIPCLFFFWVLSICVAVVVSRRDIGGRPAAEFVAVKT